MWLLCVCVALQDSAVQGLGESVHMTLTGHASLGLSVVEVTASYLP